MTKRANDLDAEGNALREKLSEQAKLSFKLRFQQILDRNRSTGSTEQSTTDDPPHEDFINCKDRRLTTQLEHQSTYGQYYF